MRNEAHRFGITHHRNRRSKAALSSEILDIPGIGPKTQEILIKHFKSVQGIRLAKKEELIEQVGEAKADILFSYFKS